MSIFNNYLAVDWSANSKPKIGADSIWLAWLSSTCELSLFNPRTRFEALALIKRLLQASDGRVLVGFDFPFGYPKVFFDNLGFVKWSDLWADLYERVKDGANNNNNRFEVANYFNSFFPKNGPFWGHPMPNDARYINIPFKKPVGYGCFLPNEKRSIETLIKSTKTVWQLNGAGSVGGQALLGIPIVESLRKSVSTSIWPFESCSSKVVCAEIYPSMYKIENTEIIKDANQVTAVVKKLHALDVKGELEQIMSIPSKLKGSECTHEGWILGAVN
jgi:precorrin-8X/cobalt-precorrin-8 methylmutase